MEKLSDKARMYARSYGQPPYGREIEGTAELLLQMADKLAEYEDLEERLHAVYGECDGLLEKVIEHLERHENVDIPEAVFKARLLTDGEVDRWEEYKTLDKKGKLLKLPCAVGDYAVFSDGNIIPVIYVTFSKEGVTVGCQNGIRISMSLQFGNWCKGFYKNYESAEAALKEMSE